jgi:SAM-dependent methyltransferase
MHPESLRRLPFDHYARYRLAADVVEVTRRGASSSILDVGGGPGSLSAFLPRDLVIASDLRFPSEWHPPAPSLVLADGGALPFPDRSFDVVVSLDTLEHVPPEHRPRLLAEAVRVSHGWVLVACPCATEGVAEADAALLAYVRQKFGEEFETVEVLTEHLAFGHPDPDRVERLLAETGGRVARFPSGRIDRWLPMMVLFYELMAIGRDDPVERVQAWYNALFYRDDLRAPSYRQAFLCRVPAADGPEPEEIVTRLVPEGPSPTPDVAAFEALRIGLTEELLRTADAYQRTIAVLETDLEAARREAVAQHDRTVAAEQQTAALEAFRQQVLRHPLVRARRVTRRLLGRGRGGPLR